MITPAHVERFRSAIGRRLGLQLEDARLGSLDELLRARLDAASQAAEPYLDRLEAEWPRSEVRALAQELTVAETYFFRNTDQWRALAEVALPERLLAQARSRRLRFLSAGCASGEEAYSLAMIVREQLSDPSWDVSILGVDVNPAMIVKAQRARYSSWALRETSPDVQQRWFSLDGRELVLADSIRSLVRFEERNLVDDDGGLWYPESYDVVFCRNVIMYLLPDRAREVIEHIARALVPGGYVFLGHAETLRGLSNDFHLCHTHGTFYYQRRAGSEPRPARDSSSAVPPGAALSLAAAVESSDTWIETNRRACERIRDLTSAPSQSAGPPAVERATMSPILELVERERYAEALERVQTLPPESARDTDVLLLRAVLLTHGGLVSRAEEVCNDLLAADEFNAGAHYVLALCREAGGDLEGSVSHDQVAAYLDPSFAMPHLHMGLLARRSGDGEAARRELGQALSLLKREDASRLLLFGGGFSRDALVVLCRTELIASGGAP